VHLVGFIIRIWTLY